MPKKGKNKGKGRHRSVSYSGGDVKLNDFANTQESRPGPSKIKKANSNTILLEEKLNAKEEDLDWFDKSFDDSEYEEQEQQALPEPEKKKELKAERCRNKSQSSKAIVIQDAQNEGIMYPPDLWHVLSDYIQPSEVGRFAGICRFAYEVTKTSKFWMKLYASYSRPLATLPLRLQPHLITCKIQGLRSSVIRSLYYLYEPFVERHRLNQEQEPHCLINRKCVSTWHQKGKIMYNYFFKMEDQSQPDYEIPVDPCLQKTSLTHHTRMLGDIFANSEKRFRILQVTSKHYISVPPTILGHTLLTVTSSLSNDFQSHTVRLIFGPAHTLRYYPKGKLTFDNIPDGSTGLLLNNVVMTKVLDWWSPNYPCSSAEEASTAAFIAGKSGNNPRQQQREEPVDLYF